MAMILPSDRFFLQKKLPQEPRVNRGIAWLPETQVITHSLPAEKDTAEQTGQDANVWLPIPVVTLFYTNRKRCK